MVSPILFNNDYNYDCSTVNCDLGVAQRQSRYSDNEKALMNAFVNIPDQVLLSNANLKAVEDSKITREKKSRRAWAGVVGLFALDSAIRKAKPTLSSKLSTFARSGIGTAALFAIPTIYYAIENKIKSHSKKIQRAEQKRPVLKTIFDVTAILGLATLGIAGITKASNVLLKKYPQKAMKIMNEKADMALKINNSFIAKKIYNPLINKASELAGKKPFIAQMGTVGKWGLAISPYAAMLGILSSGVQDSVNVSNNTYKNFAELKNMQNSLERELYC